VPLLQYRTSCFTDRALGASIVAVSPELPDRQIGTKESNQLSFPILNDVGNRVAKQFGIVYELPTDLLAVYRMLGHDLTDANGLSGATEHPLPATFVVSPTGKIRLAYIDEDYAKRLSPDDIVVALRQLRYAGNPFDFLGFSRLLLGAW
jgi:peroxiredoxin